LSALRLHQFIPASHANGPGRRAVIWVQGCSLGCPGCFNPETHDRNNGETIEVDELFQRITAMIGHIEGITVSGGEPLQQRVAVTELLRRIKKETALSVVLFTGFTWDEIARWDRQNARLPVPLEFLLHMDILIAGRYDSSQRLASGLRGSANKTVHFLTERYTSKDLEPTPSGEVIISSAGGIVLTGIDPLKW
jgi:anaerobic ribonucleoside-triphosphate reductase activating protein